MGREVRRAAIGFDWEIGKVWWGYTLPPIPCLLCGGSGKGKSLSKYGHCLSCEGEGKVWPGVEPPAYTLKNAPTWLDTIDWGWQVWETTSEGSPISPVCESPEALARWLAANDASAHGDRTATYEQWLGFIVGSGRSIGAACVDGKWMSGVEFAGKAVEIIKGRRKEP